MGDNRGVDKARFASRPKRKEQYWIIILFLYRIVIVQTFCIAII